MFLRYKCPGPGTLICAHSITTPTNHEPSELVRRRAHLLYPPGIKGHRLYKKNVRLKNIFRYI